MPHRRYLYRRVSERDYDNDAGVLPGAVNLVGLLVMMEIRCYAFASIWCAYAAVVSVIIYFSSAEAGGSGP